MKSNSRQKKASGKLVAIRGKKYPRSEHSAGSSVNTLKEQTADNDKDICECGHLREDHRCKIIDYTSALKHMVSKDGCNNYDCDCEKFKLRLCNSIQINNNVINFKCRKCGYIHNSIIQNLKQRNKLMKGG